MLLVRFQARQEAVAAQFEKVLARFSQIWNTQNDFGRSRQKECSKLDELASKRRSRVRVAENNVMVIFP